jgi:hypothetical protein
MSNWAFAYRTEFEVTDLRKSLVDLFGNSENTENSSLKFPSHLSVLAVISMSVRGVNQPLPQSQCK